MSERPTRVEVGQFWTIEGTIQSAKVVEIEPDKPGATTGPVARFDNGWWGWSRLMLSPVTNWVYLGPQDAEPAKGGPPWKAGQRFTWCKTQQWTFTGNKTPGGRWEAIDSNGHPGSFSDAMISWNSFTLLDAAPPQPDVVVRTPGPIQREVSGDGRNWINYDRLTDADPFESYRHRRENGLVIVAAAQTSVRIVGTYEQPMRGGTRMSEKAIATAMNYHDAEFTPAVEPAPEHPRQSHCLDAGRGIWRTR